MQKRAFLLCVAVLLAVPALADVRDDLRKYSLDYINRERTRANLKPVKLDDDLNAFAEQRAKDVLAGKNDGMPPYMRYSFAGGQDTVSENLAGWTVSYELTGRKLEDLVRQAFESIMAEQPPLSGRKSTMLDPFATHVGLGFAWEKGKFRLAQEFVRRHVTFDQPLPRQATTADTVAVAGRPLGDGWFDSMTVHYEKPPKARRARVSEALPEQKKDYLPKLGSKLKRFEDGKVEITRYEYDDKTTGVVTIAEDGTFSYDVPFTEGPGIYTIVVWVRSPNFRYPFAATNVSIRVEEAPAVATLPVN